MRIYKYLSLDFAKCTLRTFLGGKKVVPFGHLTLARQTFSRFAQKSLECFKIFSALNFAGCLKIRGKNFSPRAEGRLALYVICSFVPLLHYGFPFYKVATLLSLNSVNVNLSDHITGN